MKKILLAGLVTGSLVFGVTCIVNADELVTNGGFETTVPFEGWTLSGNADDGSYQVTDYSHSDQAAGAFGAVGSLTYLSQELSTSAGGLYNLTFWLENTGSAINGSSKFQVKWGGATFYSSDDLDSFDYTQFTFNGLVPAGVSTEISFGFQNDPACFYIDDISVTDSSPVPEPATMLLLGTGIAGLAVVGRRKRS